jgi:hypothetical protein
MAPPQTDNFDLFAPFEEDVILEVRKGTMKNMPGLKIQSGIDKTLCSGRVPVSTLGVADDEHDLTFHGGPDKAIHGCKRDLMLSYMTIEVRVFALVMRELE